VDGAAADGLAVAGSVPVRVTTVLKRLLSLEGVNVTDVEFLATIVSVTITLRRRRLI
jgi:hypothetical protein